MENDETAKTAHSTSSGRFLIYLLGGKLALSFLEGYDEDMAFLKKNWKKLSSFVFSKVSNATKITGLFLFGLIVLSVFKISESVSWLISIAPIVIFVFSVQVTVELKKWLFEHPTTTFNKKSFLICLGLLVTGIVLITVGYYFSPTGVIYQSNIFLILRDIILSSILISALVAIIPFAYLTVIMATGWLKPSRVRARVSDFKNDFEQFFQVLKYFGLGIALLVGFWLVIILAGWGLYTSQEFVSGIYWDKYFCGPSKIAKATEGMVRIETESGSGTGFWIDKDLVITNNHVVLFDNYINVIAPGVNNYSADVVQTDTIQDIAILRITRTEDYESPKVLKWRKRWPILAEDVFVLGFPEGTKDVTATRGIVSSLTNDEFDSTKYIQTDASINPGNSGGPLVDICGRVLGISSSTLLNAENIGFAIDGSRIQDQLKEMIIASKQITSEEIEHGQTGAETEVVIKYYLTLSEGGFEDAYDYYSDDLKNRVLFKEWKDGYKNTFAIRFKSAKRIRPGAVEASFKTVDFPNNENEDYTTKEFSGTWLLVKEGGIWKLNYSNIKEVPDEDFY